MTISSESKAFLATFEVVAVFSHGLVNIVRVERVPSETLLLRASISLLEDLLARWHVLLQHLNREDVVDLNVMRGKAIVKEAGWEHHSVPSVPELRLVLRVEVQDVSAAHKSETREDHISGDEPDEKTRVVKGSVLQANETREDGSLHRDSLIDHEPPVVCETHHAAEAMASHLAFADLQSAEHAADGTSTLCKALVDQVLKSTGFAEDPSLESFCHFSKSLS